jgi:hypothetical protein
MGIHADKIAVMATSGQIKRIGVDITVFFGLLFLKL